MTDSPDESLRIVISERSGNMMSKKVWLRGRWISALFLFLTAALILYLTFQTQKQTEALSSPVYQWFKAHGFSGTEHELRSWAHIPEYFCFGLALALYGRFRNRHWFRMIITGSLFGLFDECLKIFLPNREFDFQDWVKDIAGILLAMMFTMFLFRVFRKDPKT